MCQEGASSGAASFGFNLSDSGPNANPTSYTLERYHLSDPVTGGILGTVTAP